MDESSKQEERFSSETHTAEIANNRIDGRDTIDGCLSQHFREPTLTSEGPLIQQLKGLSVTPPAELDNTPSVSGTPTGNGEERERHPSPSLSSVSAASSGLVLGMRPSAPGTPGGPNRLSITTPSEGNSPSTSQVSCGSVPPTLTAAFLSKNQRHYDLTPVMRNTSTEAKKYVDGPAHNSRSGRVAETRQTDGDYAVISPEDSELLHGEHLALPSDLSCPDAMFDNGGDSGPSLPPMLQSMRATSVGAMLSGLDASAAPPFPAPVELAARKHYSFTTREQYEEALRAEALLRQEGQLQEGLTPYQPSRRDAIGDDYGHLPEEELAAIFIERRQLPDGESHENHRLENPIPMDERQSSIPSIRMANHLGGSLGGSVTTYTDEDEDSLVYYVNDDASLSSRGSSLYFPDEVMVNGEPCLKLQARTSSIQQPVATTSDLTAERLAAIQQSELGNDKETSNVKTRRKRKQSKQGAFEWLQSVEVDQNVLAEAASSKFLTGQHNRTLNAEETAPVLRASFHALGSNKIVRTSDPSQGAFRGNENTLQLQRLSSSPPTLAGERVDDELASC